MRRTGQLWSGLRARVIGAIAAAVALGGVLAVAAIAGTGQAGGVPAPAAFRLADGTAACDYAADGSIACRAAGAPAAIVLEPDGDSHEDDREVGWDETTPVLLPGESWWHGEVSCRAPEREIICDAGGGTIRVSVDGAAAGSALFSEG